MKIQSVLPRTPALLIAACALQAVEARLKASENDTALAISNHRFSAVVSKDGGSIVSLSLDGQDLLGPTSGSSGIGPYLDCYCIPSGFWTPGSEQPEFELYSGTDSTGTGYGGIRMSDTYTPTGQTLEQYWFLRDGETGLHMFSRLAYYNETTPFLRNLQEFRTLFRPSTDLWTHLLTNPDHYAPLPSAEAIANEITVQDATWYLGNTTDDAYVRQEADYFTKYTFADTWRNLDAHGLFSDGSTSPDGSTYGAWVVMNSKDTYFGGPTHSDLTVDGIAYNYISSNHHGNQVPNITNGFDRTFGPTYYHFNKFPKGSDILSLQKDAAKYDDPEWNADFYDSIAKHVPNYVTTKHRGTFKVQAKLPPNAKNAVAILTQNGVDFQDNVFDTTAYQYWADLDKHGSASIPMVKEGTYRLTIYAEGVFGQYVQDHVKVTAGKKPRTTFAHWQEESEGKELWRIGTPDRSCGEYKHGYERDPTHPLHPEEYRIYWPVYDYPTEFPHGVRFKVGKDDERRDFNYIHWSVFGGPSNYLRQETYVGHGDVNNWTILFDVREAEVRRKKEATFTLQLAGAKTAAGNTDVYNASEPFADLPYTVNVNGHDLEPWIIPFNQSSSCGVRSGAICYAVSNKFTFDPRLLKDGENEMVLSLPYNATDYESALLPGSVYVQYDAMRLEVK